MSNVKRVADDLRTKTSATGVDYLITTQGGPPNGRHSLTSDAPPHETHFAIQILSRFGLAYLLASSGTLRDTWLNICAPGGTSSPAPDVDDVELAAPGKFGFLASGARDTAVSDGLTAYFPTVFPHLRALHTFPGFVHTRAAANQGFPAPVVWASSLFGPLLARTPIGNTATGYAEVPLYLVANKEARDRGEEMLFTSAVGLRNLGRPRWTVDEPESVKRLWDNMKEKLGV